MKKNYYIYTLLIFVFISKFNTLRAQQQQNTFNGLSVLTGNIHPDDKNFNINLQNELIRVRELDTSVLYDVLYEFKNTGNEYGVVTMIQPINLYFNDFRAGVRSPMLDMMGKLFVDIFKVEDPTVDIRDQLKANFGQRLFIRRYVSSQNLKQLGIICDVFRNNQRITFNKVLVEFKWVDEDPYNLNKNTEVLSMEIKMLTDVTFNPNEQFNILSFMKLPVTACGIEQQQLYAPWQLGYDKAWQGNIKNIYIQHDIFNITPVIPKSFTYTNKYVNERDQVIILNNVLPVANQRMAFYAIRNNLQLCGNQKLVEERSIIPVPVKNVTASSWVKTNSRLDNRNYVVTNEIALSDNIQAYQTGNPTNLDMFTNNFETRPYTSYKLNDLLSGNCKANSAGIELKESGNPIYAFDISNYNRDDSAFVGKSNLQMQTSWCEGVNGTGKGEYIEFELTQPVKAVKIYNGNEMDAKTFDENSKAFAIRYVSLDSLVKDLKYSIIDMKIQNLYPIKLPAGRYRIYLDGVDDSKYPVTCLSSITFDFVLQDEWYQKSIGALESVYKKPE